MSYSITFMTPKKLYDNLSFFFLVDCQENVISGIDRTHFVLTVVLLEREHKNTLFFLELCHFKRQSIIANVQLSVVNYAIIYNSK